MELWTLVRRLLLVGILMAVALALYECDAVNDRIDRCDDDTSSKYLIDPVKRATECPR